MKAIRIAVIVIAFVVIVGAGIGHRLLGREPVPATSAYGLDRAALAALAKSLPGDLPLRVNHEVVALASLPRGAVFAGEPMDPHRMVHGVYQVVYPDGFVLVDSAFGQDYFDENMAGEGNRYDAVAFGHVVDAMTEARAIVPTHEHADHIDGLGRTDDPTGIAAKVVMNRAQVENPATGELLPEALLTAVEPIPGDAPLAIAPGLVVVPAPGHTPGSQIVYVLLADGRELFLIGDVAWHLDALRELHYRPRLVTDYFLDENRAQVLDQFRTLNGLLDEPGVFVVVSHDAEQRRELVRAQVLGDGIE